ncbi:MAG: hypothetical protein ABI579_02985 [Candidatus Sumerlaeota bacterium]
MKRLFSALGFLTLFSCYHSITRAGADLKQITTEGVIIPLPKDARLITSKISPDEKWVASLYVVPPSRESSIRFYEISSGTVTDSDASYPPSTIAIAWSSPTILLRIPYEGDVVREERNVSRLSPVCTITSQEQVIGNADGIVYTFEERGNNSIFKGTGIETREMMYYLEEPPDPKPIAMDLDALKNLPTETIDGYKRDSYTPRPTPAVYLSVVPGNTFMRPTTTFVYQWMARGDNDLGKEMWTFDIRTNTYESAGDGLNKTLNAASYIRGLVWDTEGDHLWYDDMGAGIRSIDENGTITHSLNVDCLELLDASPHFVAGRVGLTPTNSVQAPKLYSIP